jgi:glycosyltransferase involved in cell wall biosynthesis
MLHVYRQVVGLGRVEPWVFAFKRENSETFPLDAIYPLHRSALSWLRRFWHVQLRQTPQPAYPSEIRSLAAGLARHRCELLHIYFGNNGLFWLPFLRQATLPVITSFHGADVRVGLASVTARRMLSELFERVALVLARSQSLATVLKKLGCPSTKLRVHCTGIPLDLYRYTVRLPPADGSWKLLQACRLVEKKGLEVSLRAFAAFHSNWPRSSLTIAGQGPLEHRLRDLATALGVGDAVRFPGFLGPNDLLQLYLASHIFLHPSETARDGNQEGIPNSLLEAMATGLPCIATLHGGIPEAIENEISGLLVTESSPEILGSSILRLASHAYLARSIGEQGAAVVRKKFDLKRQIAQLEDIYLEHCAER